jgi:pseudoazurin
LQKINSAFRQVLCCSAKFASGAIPKIEVKTIQILKGTTMIRKFAAGLAIAALMGSAVCAETIEVKMLNQGADGERMVFEPAFVQAAVGDTIRFIATDKGHNAEINGGMLPEGADAFTGRINEEIEVTLDIAGVYGVICKPHFSMGMVMTIAVGDVEIPEGYLEGRLPRKAKQRFEAQLADL